MTVARATALQEISDILEADIIPTLDDILLEHSRQLSSSDLSDIRRMVGLGEDLIARLQDADMEA